MSKTEVGPSAMSLIKIGPDQAMRLLSRPWRPSDEDLVRRTIRGLVDLVESMERHGAVQDRRPLPAEQPVDMHGANFLAGARMLAEEHARSFAALFNTGSPGVPSAEVIGRAALDMQLLAERVARLYATHPSHTRPWPKEPPHCPSCDCERLL